MDFVVLPDNPAGAALAAEADIPATQRIDHASGRPWILGDWPPGEATLVTAGGRRLVFLGPTRVDGPAMTASLGTMGSPHDLDAVASRLPGLFHLAASMDGTTRVQGSVSGARQVFTAVVDGVTVAASSVGLLLRLTKAPIDEAVLATWLLAPGGAPWPLAQRPVRRGIEPLATGHWLLLDAAGRSAQVRWWRLPPATRSLSEGAMAVRSALAEALAVRVNASSVISADLSGGLDSTTLCFLAASAGADASPDPNPGADNGTGNGADPGVKLVTYHVTPLDGANEDAVWAEKAAALLPAARHYVLPAHRAENWFDVGYTGRPNVDPEGPATWAAGLAHIQDLARRAAAEGATLHLTGLGGDELFGRMPGSVWSLARTRPVSGLRLVNRYRLANRWSLGATVRALVDRSSFARSLAAVAARIDSPPSPLSEPDFGWAFSPRMPAWATADAVEAVRRLLLETAAADPEPLDPDRSRHQALASLVFEGSTMRHVNTVLAGTGISWQAPFLDDRVVEAALSTRIDHRLASGRFKPLLAAAVRHAVPADLFERRDKGEFSAEAFRGLKENRDRLLELCEDSTLARLGLIDPVAFRSAVLDPGPMSHHLQPIDTTVACESWLRSHA